MKSANSPVEKYDVLVLGCGGGGKLTAWTMAKKGKRVAVVERRYIGGSCPNIACLPSKNIIHSAKVASYFYRSGEFGIFKENCRLDMPVVRERKRKMVDGLVDLHLANFKSSGAELIMGVGVFTGPKTIEISLPGGGKRVVTAENVVIDTGSRATVDPIPGMCQAGGLTHIEALELDQIPGHLLILGGGFVGLEFAQAMRRFGSAVTIVERNDRLVHREDLDVTEFLQKTLHDEGVKIVPSTRVTHVRRKIRQLGHSSCDARRRGSYFGRHSSAGCERADSQYGRHRAGTGGNRHDGTRFYQS